MSGRRLAISAAVCAAVAAMCLAAIAFGLTPATNPQVIQLKGINLSDKPNQEGAGTGVLTFQNSCQLQVDGGGLWSSCGLTGSFAGPVGGDLSGSLPNPKVVGLQGVSISSTPPTAGQVLELVGGVWTPETPSSGGSPGGSNTDVQFNNSGSFGGSGSLTWNGTTLSSSALSVSGATTFQGASATFSGAGSGQALVWGGSSWAPGSVAAASVLAAGSNTDVQFNSSGVLGGSPSLTWSGSVLGVGGSISELTSSTALTLNGDAAATGTAVILNNPTTMTSGTLLAIENNGTTQALVDYTGNAQFAGSLYLGGVTGNTSPTSGTVYLGAIENVSQPITIYTGAGYVGFDATQVDLYNFSNGSQIMSLGSNATMVQQSYGVSLTGEWYFTASGTGLAVTNNALIGGTLTVEGSPLEVNTVEAYTSGDALTLKGQATATGGPGIILDNATAATSGKALSIRSGGTELDYFDYQGSLFAGVSLADYVEILGKASGGPTITANTGPLNIYGGSGTLGQVNLGANESDYVEVWGTPSGGGIISSNAGNLSLEAIGSIGATIVSGGSDYLEIEGGSAAVTLTTNAGALDVLSASGGVLIGSVNSYGIVYESKKSCAMSSGTTCTYTDSSITFTAAHIGCAPVNSTAATFTGWTFSSTTVTVHASASNSATWECWEIQ
jgi:hypothetical protein